MINAYYYSISLKWKPSHTRSGGSGEEGALRSRFRVSNHTFSCGSKVSLYFCIELFYKLSYKYFFRATIQDWWDKYEKLAGMVVPRSSVLVTQDGEYALVTVTLFHKASDEFKHRAREHKYILLVNLNDFTANFKFTVEQVCCSRFYL